MITYIRNIHRYIFILSVILFSCLVPFMTANAKTLIQDDADIISDNEEEKLYNLCNSILKEYDTSIYIWTDPFISGSMNFGYKMEQFVSKQQETDVVFLMIGMCPGDRIYEIQGYGTAQDMITDKRCAKILDYMHSDMTEGKYYSAIEKFCNKSYEYMGKSPKLDSVIFSPIIQLILCLIIGILPIAIMVYNSGGRITTNSRTYLDKNNSGVIGRFDRYTYTTVKRTPKPKQTNNSSESGGGGTSHSSGGGRSF